MTAAHARRLGSVLIGNCGLAQAFSLARVLGRRDSFHRVRGLPLLGQGEELEFARSKEDDGVDPLAAVLEAARLRLRPILMTSLAFIAGVVPLVLASGAGAEMRHAMGVAVFAGMLGVTLFGLVLTPVFYVVVRKLVLRKEKRKGQQAAIETHA